MNFQAFKTIRQTFVALFGLMSMAQFSHVVAEQTPLPSTPPMDWSKPMVSRGFGDDLKGVKGRADLEQGYKAGQVAYFYKNYTQAIAHWTPIAEAGYAAAQANLGWVYQAGLGVEQDLEKAVSWYRRAVEARHPVALNNLGAMYENGLGVKKDLRRAFELYLDSARQGYRFGQYNVAQLLRDGRGTVRDLQASKQWLTKAAEQGVAAAQNLLNDEVFQSQGN